MSVALWLNTAWMWKCSGELRAFQRATSRVAAAQSEVLREILFAGGDSQFGRTRRFGKLKNTADFQAAVPLTTYDDYREPIERIAAGEPRVLTGEGITLLEPTSGSSGSEKLIPYTPLLRRQFQRGVAAWIANLLYSRPAVRVGRAYWSISPVLGPPRRSAGGIPIGFDDDAAYLGRLDAWALRRLLVMPRAASKIQDLATFRYCTLLRLLAADDLSLISIWSPTFLTALFADLDAWTDRLVDDLRRGTLSNPIALAERIARQFTVGGRRGRVRADALASIFRSSAPMAEKLAEIWPRLALISAWADASAAGALPELRRLFPHVEIQPKGLLATEGFVSFPLVGSPGAALALRSHFFEFQEVDPLGQVQSGPLRLADELDRGRRYRLVLTTGGGLYRYQLHDEVEVVDFLRECPLLRFQGKADLTCDLVGEKLAEPFVRSVLDQVFACNGLHVHFAMLVPIVSVAFPRYRLYVQLADASDVAAQLAPLTQQLEAGLSENPHYQYAVGLGQLAPVEIQLLDCRAETAWHVYQRHCVARGQKAGDVKPVALASRAGDTGNQWAEVFAPFHVTPLRSSADRRAVPLPSQA